MVTQSCLHLLLGDEGLHRTRQREAEHQGPEHLLKYETALAQRPLEGEDDVRQENYDLTSRAIATEASRSLASFSSPPFSTACATQ